MDTTNVHRTTRHHRCNHDFIDLLAKDFGFPRYALVNAFMGMPAGTQERSYHPVRVGDQGERSGPSGPDVGAQESEGARMRSKDH